MSWSVGQLIILKARHLSEASDMEAVSKGLLGQWGRLPLGPKGDNLEVNTDDNYGSLKCVKYV